MIYGLLELLRSFVDDLYYRSLIAVYIYLNLQHYIIKLANDKNHILSKGQREGNIMFNFNIIQWKRMRIIVIIIIFTATKNTAIIILLIVVNID